MLGCRMLKKILPADLSFADLASKSSSYAFPWRSSYAYISLFSRTRKSVLTSKRFDEFVSSFHVNEEKNFIVAASGEGTIQVDNT